MKKKIIIILSILIIILSSILFIKNKRSSTDSKKYVEKLNKTTEETSQDWWLENFDYVNEEIASITGSRKYKKSNVSRRSEMLVKLMKRLKKEGCIESYNIESYNAGSKSVSFQLKGGGGGAVLLEGWRKDQN